MIRFSLNFSLQITANTPPTLLVPGLMATLIHDKLYCMIACLLTTGCQNFLIQQLIFLPSSKYCLILDAKISSFDINFRQVLVIAYLPLSLSLSLSLSPSSLLLSLLPPSSSSLSLPHLLDEDLSLGGCWCCDWSVCVRMIESGGL